MNKIVISESSGGEYSWEQTYPDGYVYRSTFSMSAGEIADSVEALLIDREKFTVIFE